MRLINEAELCAAFAAGCPTKAAAARARCTPRAARHWRDKHLPDILAAQKGVTEQALSGLKELLPVANERLRGFLGALDLAPKDVITAIKVVYQAFETLRDVDLETRIVKLEEQIADQKATDPAATRDGSKS